MDRNEKKAEDLGFRKWGKYRRTDFGSRVPLARLVPEFVLGTITQSMWAPREEMFSGR